MKLRLRSPRLSALLTLAFIFAATLSIHAETEADVKAHYTKLEQMITMRDGVRLFTSIYLPKDKSRSYPIMLDRTPEARRRAPPDSVPIAEP